MSKSIKIGHAPTALGAALPSYEVISVKNSTQYDPGEKLTPAEVTELCDKPTWDVTIVTLNKKDASR